MSDKAESGVWHGAWCTLAEGKTHTRWTGEAATFQRAVAWHVLWDDRDRQRLWAISDFVPCSEALGTPSPPPPYGM